MNPWVYIKTEARLYTVGFYDPEGKWHPESDYNTADEAVERIRYLMGGNTRPAAARIELQRLMQKHTKCRGKNVTTRWKDAFNEAIDTL